MKQISLILLIVQYAMYAIAQSNENKPHCRKASLSACMNIR